MRRQVGEARVGCLATVTTAGRPHVVPCCSVLSAVDAKPKSTPALRRLDNLRAHPAASLLVDHYSDDWGELWWVRLDGNGRVVTSGHERDRAITLLAGKYEQYEATPPPGPVIALDVTAWRSWP
jgi:PPOX class probable F420-dependent enzyme